MFWQKWWRRLKRLFKKPHPGGARNVLWPTREEIALLPWFKGLERSDIFVVDSAQDATAAFDALSQETIVGFDTESKPTFVKGQVSTGPHVVQFSTDKKAYVFLIRDHECQKKASDLIKLESLKKVGFGLNHDLKQIHQRLHVTPKSVLDLESLFREKGLGRGVGAKVGVALMFKKQFRKSGKISRSNWGAHPLSHSQIMYAANDAYAAYRVYQALIKR